MLRHLHQSLPRCCKTDHCNPSLQFFAHAQSVIAQTMHIAPPPSGFFLKTINGKKGAGHTSTVHGGGKRRGEGIISIKIIVCSLHPPSPLVSVLFGNANVGEGKTAQA